MERLLADTIECRIRGADSRGGGASVPRKSVSEDHVADIAKVLPMSPGERLSLLRFEKAIHEGVAAQLMGKFEERRSDRGKAGSAAARCRK